MPPVGRKRRSGYVAVTARRNPGPPSCAAGNTFSVRSPRSRASLDLGRRRNPWKEWEVELSARGDDCVVQTRRDREVSSRGLRSLGLNGREHGTGPDEEALQHARPPDRLDRGI